MSSDEHLVASLLQLATADLEPPPVDLGRGRSARAAAPVHRRAGSSARRRRRPPAAGPRWAAAGAGVLAAAAAVAAALAITGAISVGPSSTQRAAVAPARGGGLPARHTPRAPVGGLATPPVGGLATPPPVGGTTALIRLAAAVRALPAPTGRYVVQIERQTEESSSYLKATVVDSRTGDTWTYQRGPGVPSELPMAPHFLPSERGLAAEDPARPAALRAALVAQARVGGATGAGQTDGDLAVTQAMNTLWDPLVQPALRAALITVISRSPGVRVDTSALDADGRRCVEITFDDTAVHQLMSVYLDPTTGVVYETSQEPDATGPAPSTGTDVYLSVTWTDTPPTVDPLTG